MVHVPQRSFHHCLATIKRDVHTFIRTTESLLCKINPEFFLDLQATLPYRSESQLKQAFAKILSDFDRNRPPWTSSRLFSDRTVAIQVESTNNFITGEGWDSSYLCDFTPTSSDLGKVTGRSIPKCNDQKSMTRFELSITTLQLQTLNPDFPFWFLFPNDTLSEFFEAVQTHSRCWDWLSHHIKL